MGNYDEWKQLTPDEPRHNFCDFGGEHCENIYCSKVCKKEFELMEVKKKSI